MARALASGEEIRAASSREPAPVTVRSMAPSRLWVRSPDAVFTSSRLERVAASTTRMAPAPVILGGWRTPRRPIWVSSTYLRRPAIAHRFARENAPRPARSETPRRAFKRNSPETLSKEADGMGVAAAPACSMRRLRPASANSASLTRISDGASRISSPGRSARGTAPTSNSPVEMSSEASAMVWPVSDETD